MPIPFDQYDYLKIRDLERCPYPMFSPSAGYWHGANDFRMLLIALDRYADVLQKKYIDVIPDDLRRKLED